jgi:phosphohistidine phosphatase
VLCSTAVRTRETYLRLEPALAGAPVRDERGVYAASRDELLERLRAVQGDITGVLLIGHNPGIQELALLLARPSAERDRLRAKFPTGALATLEFDVSRWFELESGCPTVIACVRPRDIDR